MAAGHPGGRDAELAELPRRPADARKLRPPAKAKGRRHMKELKQMNRFTNTQIFICIDVQYKYAYIYIYEYPCIHLPSYSCLHVDSHFCMYFYICIYTYVYVCPPCKTKLHSQDQLVTIPGKLKEHGSDIQTLIGPITWSQYRIRCPPFMWPCYP